MPVDIAIWTKEILMIINAFMAWRYCDKQDVCRVIYYCTWAIIFFLV